MGVHPDEDVVACIVDLLRYDEKLARPNHHVLATLCPVNRVFLAVSRRYLYQWVRLTTDDSAKAFVASCTRRAVLGRSVHILQVDLQGRNINKTVEHGVVPKLLAAILSCCPNTRMLILRALNPLTAAVRSAIATTQAARGLKVLRMSSVTNNVVPSLLAAFPLVDRIHVRFDYFIQEYTLPAGRQFVEVAASARFVAPSANTKAFSFVQPAWEGSAQLEVFSLVTKEVNSPVDRRRDASSSLRSLSLDTWDKRAAAFATTCPNLVEIKLWHPFVLEDPLFLDSLPATLTHFAYPSLGESFRLWGTDERGYQHEDELAPFPGRMRRLKTISTYDVNSMTDGNDYSSFVDPTAWAAALPRIAEAAGIAHRHFDSMREFVNSSITLENDTFPPRPMHAQLAALQMAPEDDAVGAVPAAPRSRLRTCRDAVRALLS